MTTNELQKQLEEILAIARPSLPNVFGEFKSSGKRLSVLERGAFVSYAGVVLSCEDTGAVVQVILDSDEVFSVSCSEVHHTKLNKVNTVRDLLQAAHTDWEKQNANDEA